MPLREPDTTEHLIIAGDGTRLAAYAAGSEAGPPMVLLNGLGGNLATWKHLVRHFSPRFRILTWDYRGLFRSGLPDRPDAYSISDHRLDLQAVLDYFGVDRALMIGWSMGVPLAFEAWRHSPQRVAGLVLVNGSPGRPLDTAFRSGWASAAFPAFLRILSLSGPVLAGLGPLFLATRIPVAAAKSLGLISPTLDETVFFELAHDYVRLDFESYAATFRHLALHDARDLLPFVSCPTLVVAGDRDFFTPVEVSQEMARVIPDSEIMIVRGGSHYTPIEYPMVVNLRIDKFLRERLESGW